MGAWGHQCFDVAAELLSESVQVGGCGRGGQRAVGWKPTPTDTHPLICPLPRAASTASSSRRCATTTYCPPEGGLRAPFHFIYLFARRAPRPEGARSPTCTIEQLLPSAWWYFAGVHTPQGVLHTPDSPLFQVCACAAPNTSPLAPRRALAPVRRPTPVLHAVLQTAPVPACASKAPPHPPHARRAHGPAVVAPMRQHPLPATGAAPPNEPRRAWVAPVAARPPVSRCKATTQQPCNCILVTGAALGSRCLTKPPLAATHPLWPLLRLRRRPTRRRRPPARPARPASHPGDPARAPPAGSPGATRA